MTARRTGLLLAAVLALTNPACSQQPVTCGGPCTGGVNCSCSGKPALSLLDAGGVTLAPTESGNYALDFGTVTVGVQAGADLWLQNDGSCSLDILSVDAPSDSEFTFDPPLGTILPVSCQPDGGPVFRAIFAPIATGQKTATVTFETDSTSAPSVTVELIGAGVN